MKKTILLTLSTLVLATSLFAQESKIENEFKKYKIGIFIGPTFNSLKPMSAKADDYTVTKEGGHTGFSMGINFEKALNAKYFIYSGLSTDWRGGSISTLFDTSKVLPAGYAKRSVIDHRLQYITIPVGFKMQAAEFDKIKIFANVGGDLGVLIGNKGNYSITKADNTVVSEDKVKLGDYAKAIPINLGWHVGVSGEYELQNGSAASFGLLYRNGFLPDATTPKLNKDGFRYSDGNIRQNSFAIRIGYYF